METPVRPAKKSRRPEQTAQPSLFDWAAKPKEDPFRVEPDDSLSKLLALAEAEVEAEVEEVPPEPEPAVDLGPRIYSVTELTDELRDDLAERYPQILVQGEIADFKGIHRNGHLYCGLKDDKSQMRMVMWRGALTKVPFEVKGGLEVICTGRLDFYGGSGSLQFVAEKMEPVGVGALQLKFEQLKEKLRAEGLFDPARKKRVPTVSWRIGIVTSLTGAALQDMLRIFRIRFPLAEVFVFHAAVQGEKAPAEIVAAIQSANRFSLKSARPLDVLIVGRGGGSYEDLFCFNDESVARALSISRIPTVSAVGHEIDTTIADGVADRRAATPSHAAQETTPDVRLWLEELKRRRQEFGRYATRRLDDLRNRVDQLSNRVVAASPERRLARDKDLLAQSRRRLEFLMTTALERRKARLSRASAVLDALSPLRVLERGFSVAAREDGRVLRSVQDVSSGDKVTLRFRDGEVHTRVE